MAITADKYKARAVGQVVLGESGTKKTPFIEFYFEITDGENKGGQVRWTGYFPDGNDKVKKRTVESLQYCGWTGEDLAEFLDGELHGLDANEVQIDVGIEEYEKDGEKRSAPRVQWVNKSGGFLNVQNAMSKDKAESFSDRMRGLVMKSREKIAKTDGTDFEFGENAKPDQKKASGTKGW